VTVQERQRDLKKRQLKFYRSTERESVDPKSRLQNIVKCLEYQKNMLPLRDRVSQKKNEN